MNIKRLWKLQKQSFRNGTTWCLNVLLICQLFYASCWSWRTKDVRKNIIWMVIHFTIPCLHWIVMIWCCCITQVYLLGVGVRGEEVYELDNFPVIISETLCLIVLNKVQEMDMKIFIILRFGPFPAINF